MASNRRVPDVEVFSEGGIKKRSAVAAQSVNIAECRLLTAWFCLPSARPEILANPDRVVPSPRPIRPQVSSAQISIPRPEAIEKKVLSDSRFEAFSEVYSSAPRVLNADCVK